jgi:hypothetical protein
MYLVCGRGWFEIECWCPVDWLRWGGGVVGFALLGFAFAWVALAAVALGWSCGCSTARKFLHNISGFFVQFIYFVDVWDREASVKFLCVKFRVLFLNSNCMSFIHYTGQFGCTEKRNWKLWKDNKIQIGMPTTATKPPRRPRPHRPPSATHSIGRVPRLRINLK